MNYTALLHKGANEDAACVSAYDVLKFATVNGASALGINSGKIQVGANADIILLDLDVPQFCPRGNLISALSYSANGSEVDTVIINGKTVMRKKELLTVDEEKVYYNVDKITQRLMK